jgi:hypothetical protein
MVGQPSAGREHDNRSLKGPTRYYSLQENLDRVGARVCCAFPAGLLVGASYGTLRGVAIWPAAIASAASCAMVATACFGSERIFYSLLPRPFPYYSSRLEGKQDLLSHALGGMLGGGCIGWLYRGRPLSGSFFFAPLMVGVAFLERRFKAYKLERLEEMIAQLEKK